MIPAAKCILMHFSSKLLHLTVLYFL